MLFGLGDLPGRPAKRRSWGLLAKASLSLPASGVWNWAPPQILGLGEVKLSSFDARGMKQLLVRPAPRELRLGEALSRRPDPSFAPPSSLSSSSSSSGSHLWREVPEVSGSERGGHRREGCGPCDLRDFRGRGSGLACSATGLLETGAALAGPAGSG